MLCMCQTIIFEPWPWTMTFYAPCTRTTQPLFLSDSPVQHYASRSGHVDVCRLLLSSGAKVNVQTPGGVTPLHRAAYCGHVGVVRTLLDGGAKVTLVDSDGKTPLHKVKGAIINGGGGGGGIISELSWSNFLLATY